MNALLQKRFIRKLFNPMLLSYLGLCLFAALMVVSPELAQAAGGGLSKLEGEAKSWSKYIYAFIGACAVIYLLFEGVKIWLNKGTWGDFGEAFLKVAAVGAVPTAAVAAWDFFSS